MIWSFEFLSDQIHALTCFSCSNQSESLVVCDVDEDLVKKLKEFRFRKETNNAAIISEYLHFMSFSFFSYMKLGHVFGAI